MSYALNEVQALARKAARGAGYSWSLSDEAARATKTLTSMGLDGCACLVALLTSKDVARVRTARMSIAPQRWRSTDAGPLCPLQVGTALWDRQASLDLTGAGLEIAPVMCPGLVLPYAVQIARHWGTPLWVDIGGHACSVSGSAVRPATLPPPDPAPIRLRRSDTALDPGQPARRAKPAPSTWATLERLAHRTYAPATAASRAKGAGGDLPDTD